MSTAKGIALIGNLGRGQPSLDGQTLRTQLVLAELRRRAAAPVAAVDTAWLSRRPFRVFLAMIASFRKSDIVLIMPGERGLKVLLPIFQRLASMFGCAMHYLVVGGWLPDFLKQNSGFAIRLGHLDGIYVQSQRMLTELETLGLSNAHYLSNFKRFRARQASRVTPDDGLSLVFLSRIIPEKGVEHCFEALRILNEGVDKPRVSLDLWGTVPPKHEAWFAEILGHPISGVTYRGALNQELVVDQLLNYDAMLFPTWYRGEGFPGAIVDAFAAGIPVVASDWHDNSEILTHRQTGLLFETGSVEQLVSSIQLLLDEPSLLSHMKEAAAKAAADYHVDVVIPPLFRKLGIAQK